MPSENNQFFKNAVTHLKPYLFPHIAKEPSDLPKSPRVLILGAGLSGLSCANACIKQRLNVTITDDRADLLEKLAYTSQPLSELLKGKLDFLIC